jgi:pyrimidine operon attenuation protein / uracil phosphoribosyltransferase
MAERERRLTPPYGGVFLARTRVMDTGDMQRAIWRISHEIVERNHGLAGVVLVGLQTGGVPLAFKLAEALSQIEANRPPVGPGPLDRFTGAAPDPFPVGVELRDATAGPLPAAPPPVEADPAAGVEDVPAPVVPVGTLDVAFYRDDIGLRPVLPEAVTDIPFALDGRIVVLVDDVLFTGRTIRAALDALTDYGRPRAVQLAVMIDRGHRELPIRPDFVGKNLPTRRDEAVDVKEDGVDLGEVVK